MNCVIRVDRLIKRLLQICVSYVYMIRVKVDSIPKKSDKMVKGADMVSLSCHI